MWSPWLPPPVAMVTCCHGYHPLGCGAADLVCSSWLNVIYKGSLVTSDVVIRSVLTVKLCDGLIARLSCVTLDEFWYIFKSFFVFQNATVQEILCILTTNFMRFCSRFRKKCWLFFDNLKMPILIIIYSLEWSNISKTLQKDLGELHHTIFS